MTSKDFFRQVRIAETELKILNEKLRHYEEIGLSLSSALGSSIGKNTNKSSSRVEMAAINAVDVLRDLDDQKAHFMAVIARAEQVIRQIPQDKYRRILNLRYLCGWSFRSISDELEYNDPNSVYRAHGWALHEAQVILNKQQKEEAAQS